MKGVGYGTVGLDLASPLVNMRFGIQYAVASSGVFLRHGNYLLMCWGNFGKTKTERICEGTGNGRFPFRVHMHTQKRRMQSRRGMSAISQ
jgi:hypothetical protein